jgi:hypothetical protein
MRCKSIEHLPLLQRLNMGLKYLTSPRIWTYAALEFFRFQWQPKRFWVAVSKPLQKQLQNMQAAFTQGQVLSIAPGIYPHAFHLNKTEKASEFAGAETSKVLLWVGNDAVKKNLDTVLSALANLDASYRLLVVGKAHPTKPWQDKLVRLGIADRVSYLGVVSNMEQVYVSADLLLHPTLEDTFGMVVLEAMSYGLPVVVSQENYCGLAADLQHKANAIILSAQSPVKPFLIRESQSSRLSGSCSCKLSSRRLACFWRTDCIFSLLTHSTLENLSFVVSSSVKFHACRYLEKSSVGFFVKNPRNSLAIFNAFIARSYVLAYFENSTRIHVLRLAHSRSVNEKTFLMSIFNLFLIDG